MKRNRIVINLDKNQPAAARGSRSRGGFGRVLLFVAIILLVVVGGVAAGGYFWWRHYRSGPAYSIALLADAAQRNDSATVDGILDTDKITADFVSQIRHRLPASSSAASLLPSQVDPVRDSLSAKLKDTVHEQLIKELQDLSSIAQGKPFIVVALGIPYFADIKQENNTAQVTVHVKDEQIKLTMQAESERWRITAVQDEKLAKMVADAVVRSMPSNGSQVQDSIRKQIEGLKW
ncbi:MAG: hypothetical protein DMF72_06040 [Acidobacteria bacterium]|nr:MAG: hypothetical protein DMF72_06040 [Acidobacteriota bacterium]